MGKSSYFEEHELTGIEVIDRQHAQILDLVVSLHYVSESGDRDKIGDYIDRIISTTLAHFEFEEELMAQIQYQFLNVHKRLHDQLIHRMADYSQRFDAGEEVTFEFMQYLRNWMHNHFTQQDKDYSPDVLVEMRG